jgi:long-chain acyl-CoA synthetase
VIKREVIRVALGVIASNGAAPPVEAVSSLVPLIASVAGEVSAGIGPASSLSTDLRLDSLGRVELLSAIEDRYQVEIDEAAFTATTTLAEVEQLVQDGSRGGETRYPYPKWTQRFPITRVRIVLFYILILPITRLMSRAKVRGLDHLGEPSGPVLFISNHITMTDHALILAALPFSRRRKLAIAMEGEILRDLASPPAGTNLFRSILSRVEYLLVVTLFNVFPLPKTSGFRRSFAIAGERMDRGQSLLVFPEGRRAEEGRMNPFKPGIGLLVKGLDVPVVPIYIGGLYDLKQQNKHFARRGQVTVTFGEPVTFDQDADPTAIASEMEGRVGALGKRV